MVEYALLFAAGFLSASLLALIVAPAIWRRAVSLTRRRVEAALPLTLDAIEADKDRLRAEFAMTARRLEMSADAATAKAAEQSIEIGRGAETLKQVSASLGEAYILFEAEKQRAAGLEAQIAARVDDIRRLTDDNAQVEKALRESQAEAERLAKLLQDASYESSSRQIELVAREQDIERLEEDLATAGGLYEQEQQSVESLRAELHAERAEIVAQTAQAERERQRLRSSLAERDGTIAALGRQVADLGEELEKAKTDGDEGAHRLAEAKRRIEALEAGIAVMAAQQKAREELALAEPQRSEADFDSERRRLKDRLALIVGQNRKLRAELAGLQARPSPLILSGDPDAALREQIGAIAAQVVQMTRALEGPDSPIDRALALGAPAGVANTPGATIVSLADRIRALQKRVARSGD